MRKKSRALPDQALIDLVNEIGELLMRADDGESSTEAIGLLIGIAVARQGDDLDEAMASLRDVASHGMRMVAEGSIGEVPIN